MSKAKFYVVALCDYDARPVGGQLTTAKHVARAFGSDAALIGYSVDGSQPEGRWSERVVEGSAHPFFSLGLLPGGGRKGLIPSRLKTYLSLRKHRDAVLAMGRLPAFVQAPEDLFVVRNWGLPSLCFRFPGVSNALSISRYAWARHLARVFDHLTFNALQGVETILASADEEAIAGLVARSKGQLSADRITQWRTRVDTERFHPDDRAAMRQQLGIAGDAVLYACLGRIGKFKGWPLVLDAFTQVLSQEPRSRLVFIGDGEEGAALRASIAERGLSSSASVTGFVPSTQVACWLQACDAVVSGSLMEGWSLAMLEALATGLPLVSTAVSGVAEMVVEGENGFILPDRDPRAFAAAMSAVRQLPAVCERSLAVANKHSVATMRDDLLRVWPGLRAALSAP